MTPWLYNMRQSGTAPVGLLPVLCLLVGSLLGYLAWTQFNPDAPDAGLLVLEGDTMGTSYRVLVAEQPLSAQQRDRLTADLSALLEYLDRDLFSTYSTDSQLSKLNNTAPGSPFPVSVEFMQVVQAAFQVYADSWGSFDITIKPLVDLWGFGVSPAADAVPGQAQITAALSRTGMDKVLVDAEALAITRLAEITLDLSAIAKGYAVDQVGQLLQDHAISNFLVEIGGEVLAMGRKPDGFPWQLGIEAPVAAEPILFQALKTGPLTTAIASSGTYRNLVVHDSKRYPHILDPLTGWPVDHDLVSVTVIHESTMLADAWATALLVLGPGEGMKLANELQLAAYFITTTGNGFSAHHSDAFNKYL